MCRIELPSRDHVYCVGPSHDAKLAYVPTVPSSPPRSTPSSPNPPVPPLFNLPSPWCMLMSTAFKSWREYSKPIQIRENVTSTTFNHRRTACLIAEHSPLHLIRRSSYFWLRTKDLHIVWTSRTALVASNLPVPGPSHCPQMRRPRFLPSVVEASRYAVLQVRASLIYCLPTTIMPIGPVVSRVYVNPSISSHLPSSHCPVSISNFLFFFTVLNKKDNIPPKF